MTQNQPGKEPIRWTGVLFAFAATLLLVTGADALIGIGNNASAIVTVFAPLVAGAATALYTRSRGGLHALIGALIALPALAFIVFPNAWPLAIFATLFCILGATLTELGLRRPTT
ncbi:MAG: hypothetical protein IT328_26160 [Caldilineaceae bacterium]|nr:hypothetical protein [Caldilineaceae bacterium]